MWAKRVGIYAFGNDFIYDLDIVKMEKKFRKK